MGDTWTSVTPDRNWLARRRALELAVSLVQESDDLDSANVLPLAERFRGFLVGQA